MKSRCAIYFYHTILRLKSVLLFQEELKIPPLMAPCCITPYNVTTLISPS